MGGARTANEDELIDWLRRRTAGSGGRLLGDDAAVLPRSERWAVTMDSQIEGVHFFSALDPAILARRLLAVNLSDLAAMGAMPAFGFLALSAPGAFDHRRFFTALIDACDQHGLELAGGDLSSNIHVAAVLTLLGRKPRAGRWLRRDAARVGHDVWLGGTLGEAAAGLILLQNGATTDGRSVRLPDELGVPPALRKAARRAVRRQLEPRPQLDLGRWLGSSKAGAAIDVSDGLALDLFRLCSQSGVGAEIDLGCLPISEDLPALSQAIGRDWRQLALAGGEDYVLLFTLPHGTEPPASHDCTRIGSIAAGSVYLLADGEKKPLSPAGWDHLSA